MTRSTRKSCPSDPAMPDKPVTGGTPRSPTRGRSRRHLRRNLVQLGVSSLVGGCGELPPQRWHGIGHRGRSVIGFDLAAESRPARLPSGTGVPHFGKRPPEEGSAYTGWRASPPPSRTCRRRWRAGRGRDRCCRRRSRAAAPPARSPGRASRRGIPSRACRPPRPAGRMAWRCPFGAPRRPRKLERIAVEGNREAIHEWLWICRNLSGRGGPPNALLATEPGLLAARRILSPFRLYGDNWQRKKRKSPAWRRAGAAHDDLHHG
jgi:hypothetical protein